jgi:hypothetical protein
MIHQYLCAAISPNWFMQVEQPTKKGDTSKMECREGGLCNFDEYHPINEWGAPHCHNFRALHVLWFLKSKISWYYITLPHSVVAISNCNEWIMNTTIVLCWHALFYFLKSNYYKLHRNGRGSTHPSSHNASSSTCYNNKNRTPVINVGKWCVGPTELGIWELKVVLHCFNETMG